MGDIPCALEFRNRTWFSEEFYEQTLSFMEKEGWIHSVCDEPQVGEGSIPPVIQATHRDKTLVRFHGRNKQGWLHPADHENWREVRYLYLYNEAELKEWKRISTSCISNRKMSMSCLIITPAEMQQQMDSR